MMEKMLSDVKESIANSSGAFEEMSDAIWDYAEVRFAEFKSSKLQMQRLREQGFSVVTPIGGLETAFYAEYGQGYPVIAILGEYDALFGMSHPAGLACEDSDQAGGPGHGCGHNLLGTAGVEAVCTLKQVMEKNGVAGTIRYYGCPAEEGGGGKNIMLKANAFDDVDVVLSWHPNSLTRIYTGGLAALGMEFEFKGISAHANVMPEAGRSALDAAELMNIGTQFLREHVKKTVSIQYAFLDAGGPATNIIPDHAKLSYTVRGTEFADVVDTMERLKNVAKGAALMTGTESLSPVLKLKFANILPNETLMNVVEKYIKRVIPIQYSTEEWELANAFKKEGTTPNATEALSAGFHSDRKLPSKITTDYGDVTWVIPGVCFSVTTCAVGTRMHNWMMTAQGKTKYAKKGMHVAAEIMASTAVDLFCNPYLVEQAKRDHVKALAGRDYFQMF